ncbi:MAG: hypothetical protein IT379_30250 [Deltaproteobacteria bacterium]|nr:hypothetical protein [Deltaproteobacteria bacterium]
MKAIAPPIDAVPRAKTLGPLVRWVSVAEAAAVLGVPVITLRRSFERNARRQPDGGIAAELDGVRAKKFGRQWRVWLSPSWTDPDAVSR